MNSYVLDGDEDRYRHSSSQNSSHHRYHAQHHITRETVTHWNAFTESVLDMALGDSEIVRGKDYYPIFLDTDFRDRVELEISRSAVRYQGVFGSSLEFSFGGDYLIYLNHNRYVSSGSCYFVVDSAETRDQVVTLTLLNFTAPRWDLSLRAFREDGALRNIVRITPE